MVRVMPPILPMLTDTQQAFITAAHALGATSPAYARPLPELPRLSSAELNELVDVGIVREAADWRYYVFRSARQAVPLLDTQEAPPRMPFPARWTPGRVVRLLIFWLLILLIPVVLIQLTSGR